MKAMMFDGLTRDLGEGSTRRSLLRLLGGAAAVGAGIDLTGREESFARAKGHGTAKAQAHDQVRAAGKSKKITICYNGTTRTAPKRGWAQKYPGATKDVWGPIGQQPGGQQPAACTSWIFSGGPDRTTPIGVDGDLLIMVNGVNVLNDANGLAGSIPPVAFPAEVGQSLGVVARDVNPACRSLTPLWLHCASTGQKRQLFAGNNDGCAPVRTAGTFVSEVYTISV
jgi:hypothetical protein